MITAIQDLLTSPNIKSPANTEASYMLQKSPAQYAKRIRLQAIKFAPSFDDVEIL